MDPGALLSGAAGRWLPLLLEAALRGTVLLGLAALSSRLLRRSRAAARHLTWELALVGLLVLPAALPLLPRWSLPVLPAAPPTARRAGPAAAGPDVPSGPAAFARGPGPVAAAPSGPARVEEGGLPGVPAVSRIAAGLTSPAALFLLWLAGFLVVLGRFVAARLCVASLARSARPPPEGTWRFRISVLAAHAGVRRPVRLLLGPHTAPPMTWGLVRPTILLPADATSWPRARLRTVLLHELEHVRRLDGPVQALVRLAAAVYWFHPGVWLAAGELRLEREKACDDGVLRHGVQASEYGRQLVEFARRMRGAVASVGSALTAGRRSDLARRLEAILERGRVRAPIGRWGAFLGAVLGLTLVALVGVAEPARRAARDPARTALPAARSRDTFLPAVAVPSPPAAGVASAGAAASATDPGAAGSPERADAAADEPGPARTASAAAPPPRLASAGGPGRAPSGRRGVHDGRPRLPSPVPASSSREAAPPAPLATLGSGPEAAAESLRDLGPRAIRSTLSDLVARGTTPALTEVMEMAYLAPRTDERVAAVRSLGHGGRRASRFLLQIVRAHPEPEVRRAGLESLAGLETRQVVPWLVDVAYHDRDVTVEREAVRALAHVDGSGSDAGLLQLARSHPLTAVRLEAFFWLVQRGSGEALAAYVAAA
ncbi:MAG TPA: M56 family metallopeptidase [Gemmatimonadota bacterium]|nr:M56 family metallopeptidase [Gemmatimonadota bacterium]